MTSYFKLHSSGSPKLIFRMGIFSVASTSNEHSKRGNRRLYLLYFNTTICVSNLF